MQNNSHAVMGRRHEPDDSLDYFPTPPWAVRALLEHELGGKGVLRSMTCLEPACGEGHMVRALAEYFREVSFGDVHGYGFGEIRDFLASPYEEGAFDWIITNPPFRLAEDFVHRAHELKPRAGIAMLVRTTFMESVGRYRSLFAPKPPAIVAQFSERVPMLKGRLDRTASTATSYAWYIWLNLPTAHTRLVWLPPCRATLERPDDYDAVPQSTRNG